MAPNFFLRRSRPYHILRTRISYPNKSNYMRREVGGNMELLSKPRLLVLFALMVFALDSCGCPPKVNDFKKASKINSIMDSWIGHHQSELIACWGPPTKIISDGNCGWIIIYESLKGTWGNLRDKRIVGGAHYPTKGRQPGYAATRTFYVNVDEQGIIYSWKCSGL